MGDSSFSMVEECTDSYEVAQQPDGSAIITMRVPKRFVVIWMTKLSDLRTTTDEVDESNTEEQSAPP